MNDPGAPDHRPFLPEPMFTRGEIAGLIALGVLVLACAVAVFVRFG